MAKVAIGALPLIYPLPAVLVGANVDGKPNFSTYAWCGIVNELRSIDIVTFDELF